MKRILVAGVALAAIGCAPAIAADIPAKAPYYTAPPVALYSWAGFYVGGHVGGGWGETDWAFVSRIAGASDRGTFVFDVDHELSGFIGGGHLGYNWQFNQWVFGLEASWTGGNINGSLKNTDCRTACDDIWSTRVSSILLLTARSGYAWDRSLWYIKGGYANAEVRVATFDSVPGTASSSSQGRHGGFTIGTGYDYMLSPNWIIGVEYDFVHLAKRTHTQVFVPAGGQNVDRVSADLHLALLRLSYKFGGPIY
jgi:outer membrane immunogenic protein